MIFVLIYTGYEIYNTIGDNEDTIETCNNVEIIIETLKPQCDV